MASVDIMMQYNSDLVRTIHQVPMLNKRCRLGVATLGGKIYACGGYDGSSFLRTVECFDPVANT